MLKKQISLLLVLAMLLCLAACGKEDSTGELSTDAPTTASTGTPTTTSTSTPEPTDAPEPTTDSNDPPEEPEEKTLFEKDQIGTYSMKWTSYDDHDQEVSNTLKLTINADETVTFEDKTQKWSAVAATVTRKDNGSYSFTYFDNYIVDKSEYENETYNPYRDESVPVERMATFRFENGLIYLNANGTEFPIIKPTAGLNLKKQTYYLQTSIGCEYALWIHADGTVSYGAYVVDSAEDDEGYEVYDENCGVYRNQNIYYFVYEDLSLGSPVAASFTINANGSVTLNDDLLADAVVLEKYDGELEWDNGEDWDSGEYWTPETDTPYVFSMYLEQYEEYFLAAGMNGNDLATTQDIDEALDIYLEQTNGGYYLYCMVNGVKNYINMAVSTDSNRKNIRAVYETTAKTVYTYEVYDDGYYYYYGALETQIDGETYTFGSYGQKTTMEPVNTSQSGYWADLYSREDYM